MSLRFAISVLAEILQVKNGASGGVMNQVSHSYQEGYIAEVVEI